MNNPLPTQSNEKDILSRIVKARGTAEPEAPTDEPIVNLEVTPDEVEVEEVEELPETLEAAVETVETGEPEQADELEDIYDVGGREITLKRIEELEQGNLMQSDYTRKTQVLAEDRKLFEAVKESTTTKNQQLDDSISQLKVFIDEFDTTEVDGMTLEELRDIDPSQYLKVTEQQAKRKQALKEAKGLKAEGSDADRQALASSELSKLISGNPHWLKDGKETKAYQSDMTTVTNYLNDKGYTEAQQVGILTAGQGQVFIDAAKYHASKKTNAAITKKVRKAPIMTKPSGASRSATVTALDKAKANHKKLGTVQSAMALRKAQLNF